MTHLNLLSTANSVWSIHRTAIQSFVRGHFLRTRVTVCPTLAKFKPAIDFYLLQWAIDTGSPSKRKINMKLTREVFDLILYIMIYLLRCAWVASETRPKQVVQNIVRDYSTISEEEMFFIFPIYQLWLAEDINRKITNVHLWSEKHMSPDFSNRFRPEVFACVL